jgi:hypothetical protein
VIGRALCALGLHSWRDVSRSGQSVERVHVCRRGCGERRTTWEEER